MAVDCTGNTSGGSVELLGGDACGGVVAEDGRAETVVHGEVRMGLSLVGPRRSEVLRRRRGFAHNHGGTRRRLRNGRCKGLKGQRSFRLHFPRTRRVFVVRVLLRVVVLLLLSLSQEGIFLLLGKVVPRFSSSSG